ncbi:MAG TPA: hypothetical protein DEA22_02140 [Blastocatellia bacterium]|nr:hypothetical protein [Blastocatellia bacterium]
MTRFRNQEWDLARELRPVRPVASNPTIPAPFDYPSPQGANGMRPIPMLIQFSKIVNNVELTILVRIGSVCHIDLQVH